MHVLHNAGEGGSQINTKATARGRDDQTPAHHLNLSRAYLAYPLNSVPYGPQESTPFSV